MTTSPQQAVILCGGLGTRLRPLTDSLPKPMVLVNGKPFLEHLLKQLATQGIRRFLLLTGYLGEKVSDYFGDGSSWGWQIEYSQGPKEWDTGRRFWEGREKMDSRFLFLYSDNFVQFSLPKLLVLHQSEQVPLSLLLAPKAKGNIRVSKSGRIEAYDKTRTELGLDYVEVGYMIVEKNPVLEVFQGLSKQPDISFSEVLQNLAAAGCLLGLVVKDPYHSISDPERLALMSAYLKPKNILLIDRDGVINKRPPKGQYVRTWDDFFWVPETQQAMKELALLGFKFVVISNQAGVARGMIDKESVDRIHHEMVSQLKRDGVEVLAVHVCPHHWDDHCECRKPEPGMFFKASRDYLLRMDQTIFVGDDPRDAIAAYNAGCLCVLVGDDDDDRGDFRAKPTLKTATFLDALPWIKERFASWAEY